MKKKIALSILALAGTLVLIIGLCKLGSFIKTLVTKNNTEFLESVGEEELTPDDEEEDFTPDISEDEGWLSEYRVIVLNKGYLMDNGLTDKGAANLESALTKYLDQVDPDGGNYYVHADENYFKDGTTWVDFYIILDDTDIKIHCLYTIGNVSGYNFSSPFDVRG